MACPPHVRLNVAHDTTLEHDLGLVLLDIPVGHRREEAGDSATPRHDAPPAIDQDTAVGIVQGLALLYRASAELEDLLVRRRSRRDLRERLAVEDDARL